MSFFKDFHSHDSFTNGLSAYIGKLFARVAFYYNSRD
jgi:hypothetical protein